MGDRNEAEDWAAYARQSPGHTDYWVEALHVTMKIVLHADGFTFTVLQHSEQQYRLNDDNP